MLRSRYKWGIQNSCSPSRFIKEIDIKYLELPPDFYPVLPGARCHNLPKRKSLFLKPTGISWIAANNPPKLKWVVVGWSM